MSSEEGYSYVAILRFSVVPLDKCIIPAFSPKLVKTIIYLIPELEIIRKLYESRDRFKPFSITPLMTRSGKPLIGNRSHKIGPEEELEFRISIAIKDVDALENLGYIDTVVSPHPLYRVRVYAKELEIISPDSMSIELTKDKLVRFRFLSPVLLSTKLMAPPLEHFLKRVRSVRERYVLYPSPAHICSYLTKLWNKLFPHKPISRKVCSEWAAYYMGRLCEVAMIVMDLETKPITIVYDRNRKPRGFTGWALYEICLEKYRRMMERLDKLFALANYMGIGKSRSIGFGTVRVETIERRE